MSNELKKLQEIGAQKIHEKTHISREHVQSLLYESFENFTKIQFLGFISILERDYEIKLDELKEKGLSYFNDQSLSQREKEDSTIFVVSKKKKSYKKIYIVAVAVIFIIAILYTISASLNNDTGAKTINESIIDDAKNNISIIQDTNITTEEFNLTQEIIPMEDTNVSEQEILSIKDTNATKDDLLSIEDTTEDINISEMDSSETLHILPMIDEPKITKKSLKIIPKIKLWVGYIDISTHKKLQKTLKKEMEFDPDKEWLFALGHGDVSFDVNGELKKFHSKENMRFLYKDKKLTQIDLKKFKELNKGKGW